MGSPRAIGVRAEDSAHPRSRSVAGQPQFRGSGGFGQGSTLFGGCPAASPRPTGSRIELVLAVVAGEAEPAQSLRDRPALGLVEQREGRRQRGGDGAQRLPRRRRRRPPRPSGASSRPTARAARARPPAARPRRARPSRPASRRRVAGWRCQTWRAPPSAVDGLDGLGRRQLGQAVRGARDTAVAPPEADVPHPPEARPQVGPERRLVALEHLEAHPPRAGGGGAAGLLAHHRRGQAPPPERRHQAEAPAPRVGPPHGQQGQPGGARRRRRGR